MKIEHRKEKELENSQNFDSKIAVLLRKFFLCFPQHKKKEEKKNNIHNCNIKVSTVRMILQELIPV